MNVIFKDRIDAGNQVAEILDKLSIPDDAVILALPRGGVPVAYQISKQLKLPLDVIIVRKLGAPNYKEYAIGAIAQNNIILLNQIAIESLHVTNDELNSIILSEQQELKRREHLYRANKVWPNLKNKTVILVDDGIATGFTIKAAIDAVKLSRPNKIIVAVPVASKESIYEISSKVDKVICPIIPENFYAVGAWYESFPQTTDEEVCALLKKDSNY